MKRTRFFAPWSELKAKFNGSNADVLEVLMFLSERAMVISLIAFGVSIAFFHSWTGGWLSLFVASWLGSLYLCLLLLDILFKLRQ